MEIAGVIISKLLCRLVCDADDMKLMLGSFRQTSSFQLPYLLFFNVLGICLWGKEEAITTPGVSIPMHPSCVIIDLLPLKSVSLGVVPLQRWGLTLLQSTEFLVQSHP